MSEVPQHPPGWYYAQGDPPGTNRYWDGTQWQGGPQPVPGAEQAAPGFAAPGMATATKGDPGKRILARIIDILVLLIPLILVSAIFGFSVQAGSAEQVVSNLLSGVLVSAYEVFMVGTRGGTVGKLALGLKIENENGSPVDIASALRRTGLYIAFIFIGLIPLLGALLFVVVFIAGFVMLFTDERGQTPWDKIGKTLVVGG
jgi:uncharacterized RDD family membrane protein YckC